MGDAHRAGDVRRTEDGLAPAQGSWYEASDPEATFVCSTAGPEIATGTAKGVSTPVERHGVIAPEAYDG